MKIYNPVFWIIPLLLLSASLTAIPSLELESAPGVQYSYVPEYSLHVVQYRHLNGVSAIFPLVPGWELSTGLSVLTTPPPAASPEVSFRGDWGGSLSVAGDRSWQAISLGAGFSMDFLRYWNTSVYYMTPTITLRQGIRLTHDFLTPGLDVYLRNRLSWSLRRDTAFSAGYALSLVLRYSTDTSPFAGAFVNGEAK